MVRRLFSFLFFEIVAIAFFFLVHVTKPGIKEYSIALLLGAISGLILFIFYIILFPRKKKSSQKVKPERVNRVDDRQLRREKQERSHRRPPREVNRDRHYQDTDKIYIDEINDTINGSK